MNLKSIAEILCQNAAVSWYDCRENFYYGGLKHDECKISNGTAELTKIYVQVSWKITVPIQLIFDLQFDFFVEYHTC